MSRPLTVALCQLRWSGDPARNVDQGLAMAAEGFAGGADIVVLPELAAPGYTVDPLVLAESAQAWRPQVERWHDRAVWLSGGRSPEIKTFAPQAAQLTIRSGLRTSFDAGVTP